MHGLRKWVWMRERFRERSGRRCVVRWRVRGEWFGSETEVRQV